MSLLVPSKIVYHEIGRGVDTDGLYTTGISTAGLQKLKIMLKWKGEIRLAKQKILRRLCA